MLTQVWDFGRTLGIPHQLNWWFGLPLIINRAIGFTGLKYLSVMALLKIPQGCLSRFVISFCLTCFAHRNLPCSNTVLFFVFQHAWSNGTMPTSQGPAKSCSCLLSCHLFLLRGIYQQVSVNSHLLLPSKPMALLIKISVSCLWWKTWETLNLHSLVPAKRVRTGRSVRPWRRGCV